MTWWWRPRSVRVRLTLWHLATVVVLLVMYGAAVFFFAHRSLLADLDRQLTEDFERAEDGFRTNPDGTLSWTAGDREVESNDANTGRGPWACVWSLDGRLLYRDPAAPPAVVKPAPETGMLRGTPSGEPQVFASVRDGSGTHVREITGMQDVAGSQAVLRVARSEEGARRDLAILLGMLGLALPATCLVAGLAAYLLARRALSPLDSMARAAERITAVRLSERLPVENPNDELGHLAIVFNDTVGRLESSFAELRRFTADASHEMRTPLTAIRSVGEVGLREHRDEASYREIIGSMLEEADRLNRLVESLLTLARADSGHATLSREPVDLAQLAEQSVEYLGVLAEDKRQTITIEAPHPAVVIADRLLLRQAVINLVDNAIKHSPLDAVIHVAVGITGPHACLQVTDNGPGIAPEHLARVFDRFYRVDKGRSRERGGTGLGLSIAKWAVEVHGGHVEVDSTVGVGSVFRLVLPLTAAPR